jgi:hypothetical protein
MFTEDITPDEYTALWGCDPIYDTPPNKPGDGYLFYNFSVEQNDPEFLKDFIPAVERTIQRVEQSLATDCSQYEQNDLDDLQELLEYVQSLLGE